MTECLCEAEEGISLGRERLRRADTCLESSGQGRPQGEPRRDICQEGN